METKKLKAPKLKETFLDKEDESKNVIVENKSSEKLKSLAKMLQNLLNKENVSCIVWLSRFITSGSIKLEAQTRRGEEVDRLNNRISMLNLFPYHFIKWEASY